MKMRKRKERQEKRKGKTGKRRAANPTGDVPRFKDGKKRVETPFSLHAQSSLFKNGWDLRDLSSPQPLLFTFSYFMKNSKISRTGEIHQQLVASTRRNYALVSAAYPLCSRLVVWSSEIGLSGLYCTYVHYLRYVSRCICLSFGFLSYPYF